MADTVQESNFSFFPPPQDFVTAHHAFILLLFPARYTVHSIREKRPRVSAARRAGLFSLSLSLFLRLPQATDPFSPNLAAACFSPSTGFRPPTIRSIVILRVRCELAPTRSGDPRGERAIRYTEKGEREREKALTTVARIDLALPLLFSSPARKCSHVHFETRKVFVRSAIAAKLDDGTRRVTFGTISSKLLQGFIM